MSGHPEQWLRAALETAGMCRAWPVQASEDAVPPFLVYGRTGTVRERVLPDSIRAPVATFQVAVYAETYIGAKDLAAAVRRGLDNFQGTAEGVTIGHAYLVDESDGEPVDFAGEGKPTYAVMMTFEVRYQES